jgi:uncharacterized protein (TIGR03083 family)
MSDKERVLNLIQQERQELLDLSRSLTPAEWNTPSLCEGWRVRDVLAHLIGEQNEPMVYFTTFPPDNDKANQKMVDKRKDLPMDKVVEEFAGIINKTNFLIKFMPSLFLEDTWIHQEDMRWVLGANRQRQHDPVRVQLVLEVLKKAALKKYPNIKFVATDMDWRLGEGKEVRGTGDALAMFLCRRQAARKKLEGEGLELITK